MATNISNRSLFSVNTSTRPQHLPKAPYSCLSSSINPNRSCDACTPPRLAAYSKSARFLSHFFHHSSSPTTGREKDLTLDYPRQHIAGTIWYNWFGMAKLGGALLALFVAFSMYVPPASASSPEVAFIKKTVASHEVVIFSKSYCPYCKRAKAVFKELNKIPHVIELDERDDGMDIQDGLREIVGRRTVPQVFINGKHLGGSDDTVEAYESGALSKLLDVSTKDDL